jgi:hypothetical protein
MIKKISTLLILVLAVGCLASCSKSSPLESDSNNTENAPSSFVDLDSESLKPDDYYTSLRQGESSVARYLETPYGMYHLSTDKYIYYSENGNTKYIKLCNRPDCNHSTTDCNAYAGTYRIGYYKDKIYYMSGSSLNCMDMDGGNHMGIKTLSDSPDSTFGYFHNGYFYYIITKAGTPASPANVDNNLYRVKIDDNSKPEIILTDDIILDACMFFVIDDNIYLEIYNYDVPGCYLYSYSNITGTLFKITDYWSGYGTTYFTEDYGYSYRANEGIYKYNVATNEITLEKEIKFDNHGLCGARFYPDYIYLIHELSDDPRVNPTQDEVLYIYDWNFNVIDSIKFGHVMPGRIGGFVTDVGDYIMYSSNWGQKPDYYIDKSEIGTGNLTFHKIED